MPQYEVNEIGSITVTTDTSTADLLSGAGIRAFAFTHNNEGHVEELVAQYRVAIWPTAQVAELVKARWVAVTLSRRGARVRWVQVDGLSTDLATALSTDDGRAVVKTLISDAPLWVDDGGDTSADIGNGDAAAALPVIPIEVLPPVFRHIAEHFARAFAGSPTLVLPAMLAALSASLGPDWRVGARSMVRAALLWFVLVAPPGMAKSPASRPLLEPLHEEDLRLGDEYRKKRKQYVLDLRD